MEASLWTSMFNVAAALTFVVLLAVVLLRFAAPWLQRLQTPGGAQIEVLEVKALDRQNRCALVRVRGEDFLIAVSGGSPSLLRSWPSPTDQPIETSTVALSPDPPSD